MAADPSLSEIAATGDRLATLERLRDHLAREIESSQTTARDLAALSRQLQQVLAEIAELRPPAETKGTPLDELNARRAARGSAPARTAATKAGR